MLVCHVGGLGYRGEDFGTRTSLTPPVCVVDLALAAAAAVTGDVEVWVGRVASRPAHTHDGHDGYLAPPALARPPYWAAPACQRRHASRAAAPLHTRQSCVEGGNSFPVQVEVGVSERMVMACDDGDVDAREVRTLGRHVDGTDAIRRLARQGEKSRVRREMRAR